MTPGVLSTLGPFISLGLSLAMTLAACIATVRILHRTGYSGWWILMTLVPVGNVIALWVFSRADWPGLSSGARRDAAPVPQAPPRPVPARAPQTHAPQPAPSPPQADVF